MPTVELASQVGGRLQRRQDSKAESAPHPVELAAPAGEKSGAALHFEPVQEL